VIMGDHILSHASGPGRLLAKPGHLSVPDDFLGTPGHAPSNRDCPGQTGTYGHLGEDVSIHVDRKNGRL